MVMNLSYHKAPVQSTKLIVSLFVRQESKANSLSLNSLECFKKPYCFNALNEVWRLDLYENKRK